MTEIFINATNRVYILYYSLIILLTCFIAIATPIARYITGNQTLELFPQYVLTFIVEVGKPIVYPVMIVVIGPLLEPATKFLQAMHSMKAVKKESPEEKKD